MMKTTLLQLVLIGFFSNLLSQTYNNPESIVYDNIEKRYFISNKGGNTILELDSLDNLSLFVSSGLNEPKGLLIVGDTLISVNSTSIQGFLLSDANQVFNIAVSGSSFMNDATTDGKGNLYISDSNTKKIYKLSLKTGAYEVILENDINPNGLLYNAYNNSILICNWESNARIQSFDISDSVLTELVKTKVSNLDGLAKDNCGNIYVSSWGTNAVYVYDSLFQKPPTKISGDHSGPADITINQDEQILAIPEFNSNSIKLVNLNMDCAETVEYISPLDNSTGLTDPVEFEWNSINGVSGYHLEYCTDSMFYTQVADVYTTGTDTIVAGLDPDTKYFWRVRSIGGSGKNIFNSSWSFTTEEALGTNTLLQNFDFILYPNPADNTIYIKISGLDHASIHYRLFDLGGKTVKEGMLDQPCINAGELDKGLYLLQLKTRYGLVSRKIVIE